ncbi:hypothetical protein K450DRAFT_240303 [Umbelopsis ramanniana AG]|uniref:Uncharacterized protein n=1 Tax=Umbelopsis ramanniana AG TaxID=1314678 RepID=A0AAD5HE78_UMBRA|nr:uncharacterized protein K450DRAFT_240303 [Umbelopsis ramanniana AG]KAI8579779.1 hypothetical protein K450DRAFT_240303 [Umbelopsis ramanniana AG]
MAASMKEQDTAEVRSAHHIDDIFLIDMSEAGMTPEAPSAMKADAVNMSTDSVEILTVQQFIKRQLYKLVQRFSIYLNILLYALYAIMQHIPLRSFADGRRLKGINNIRALKKCNNSDQVMNYVLAHITKQECCTSGIDRRYTLNNVLLCGLLSNHIKTVLAKNNLGLELTLVLRVLDYGIQRLEYEFGDVARLYSRLPGRAQRQDLGTPWPLLEGYSYKGLTWTYEDFCFRLLCYASFDEHVGRVGDIASHGAHNMASHDSLNVQYLVRHVIFSTVLTQDYSVLYASGGDISCLETELVVLLRQDSGNDFFHLRRLLRKHILIKLDDEANHTEFKNLKVTYLPAAATILALRKKKNRLVVHHRSAKTGKRKESTMTKRKDPTSHTSGAKHDIIVRNEHSIETKADRMIAVVGHELAVFTPSFPNTEQVFALWARLHPDGFIVKDKVLVGSYFAVIAAALTIAIWQTSLALHVGKLSGIDITSAASLYLVGIGIVTTIFKTTRAVDWSWFDFIRMQHKSRVFSFTHEERHVSYGDIVALAASYDENDKHAVLGKTHLSFLQDQEFTGNVNLPWPVPIGSLITNGFLLLKEYGTGSLLLVATTRGVYGANFIYEYSPNARVFRCEELTPGICHIIQEVTDDSLRFGELGFAALRVS